MYCQIKKYDIQIIFYTNICCCFFFYILGIIKVKKRVVTKLWFWEALGSWCFAYLGVTCWGDPSKTQFFHSATSNGGWTKQSAGTNRRRGRSPREHGETGLQPYHTGQSLAFAKNTLKNLIKHLSTWQLVMPFSHFTNEANFIYNKFASTIVVRCKEEAGWVLQQFPNAWRKQETASEGSGSHNCRVWGESCSLWQAREDQESSSARVGGCADGPGQPETADFKSGEETTEIWSGWISACFS